VGWWQNRKRALGCSISLTHTPRLYAQSAVARYRSGALGRAGERSRIMLGRAVAFGRDP